MNQELRNKKYVLKKKKMKSLLTSCFMPLNSLKGFLALEAIIAAALFVIFSTAAIAIILQGLDANRLGSEETIANQYASEGIEATRSIKNQAYTNLVDSAGTGVIRNGSNVWAFSGTNNTFGKYTRVITISDVQRDGSGNIVASAGTLDPNTKKVASTVSWNVSPTRNDSINLITYLTNWRATIAAVVGDAITIYSDSTSVARPKYRFYTNSTDTFTTGADTGSSFTDVAAGRGFDIKTSPTKQEAIAGYVNGSGVLRIMCFDGTTWTSEWTATVGGTGADQRFGIAYEKTSGDVLVVYSTNVATTNEMAYRTKLGSTGCGSANWSAATNLDPVRTSGIVEWIRMEPSPVTGSNTIGLAWADANSDLSAMEWTGSSFAVAEPAAALETNLEVHANPQDVESFDIAMESTTGNLMVVWGPGGSTCTVGTNCMKYARYTGSWSAPAGVPTVSNIDTNIDCSANPNSNEISCAGMDDVNFHLSTAYWSGSAWTGHANVNTSTGAPLAGTKLITTGWLISGATTRQIIVYSASGATNIAWYIANGSAAPVAQTAFTPTPVFANPQTWYDIQMDPKNPAQLMLIVSDSGSAFYTKRLVMTVTPTFTWTNSDGGVALGAHLGQTKPFPFGFAYWRN